MTTFLQLFISGLLTGGIYALLGLCLVIIFKATKVFNLGIGGFVQLGAFVLYLFLVQAGLPFWAAFPLFLLGSAAVGLLVERLAFRPLIGQPLWASVIVAIAFLPFLAGLVTTVWGSTPRRYEPAFLKETSVVIGGASLSQPLLVAFAAMMVMIILFAIFFRYHRMGLAMRATADDHQVAQSVGVSVRQVYSLTWMMAAVMMGVAGVFLGQVMGLTEYISFVPLKAFAVALLGGLESIAGAIMAGLIIGLAEALAMGYLNPIIGGGFHDVVSWILLMLILIIKPYGLFGLVRIERI